MEPDVLMARFIIRIIFRNYSIYKFIIFFPGLTKRRYVETVLKAIQQCKNEGVDIDVRYSFPVYKVQKCVLSVIKLSATVAHASK